MQTGFRPKRQTTERRSEFVPTLPPLRNSHLRLSYSGLTLRASVALWLVFADVIVDQLLRADSNVGLMRLAERFGDQNVFEARLVQQAAEFFAAKELETALLLKLQQKSG
jgi:hypothetical protein